MDAPVVERMRRAGAIAIGRTNLPDMGLRMHTDSALYGLTRNPWNPARTAAGSSGGEAIALATGMSPIGVGNDIGGSLRNPANACGVASIRPTQGRVPHAGFIPVEESLLAVQLMHTNGPMARRVTDVRLGLAVLSGVHPRDPWSLDPPPDARRAAGCDGRRTARRPDRCGRREGRVRDAGRALKDAGYEVVESAPPRFEEVGAVWARFLIGDFLSVRDQVEPIMGKDAAFIFRTAAASTPPLDAEGMSRLFVARDALARAWSQFMAEHPLVLTPVWTQLPFEVGFDVASAENVGATMQMSLPTTAANLFGLPSACVPAGRDAVTGLPVGVLLTGRRMGDEECLDAAEAIEQRLPLKTPIDPV